jgi:hypothetical protein
VLVTVTVTVNYILGVRGTNLEQDKNILRLFIVFLSLYRSMPVWKTGRLGCDAASWSE